VIFDPIERDVARYHFEERLSSMDTHRAGARRGSEEAPEISLDRGWRYNTPLDCIEPDAHGSKIAHIDEVGKAALSRDGYVDQPGKAGGSSLRFRSHGHRLENKVRKIFDTTGGIERA
jgi:hypothetical protein